MIPTVALAMREQRITERFALGQVQRCRQLLAFRARELKAFSRHRAFSTMMVVFTSPIGRGRREAPGEGLCYLDRP